MTKREEFVALWHEAYYNGKTIEWVAQKRNSTVHSVTSQASYYRGLGEPLMPLTRRGAKPVPKAKGFFARLAEQLRG